MIVSKFKLKGIKEWFYENGLVLSIPINKPAVQIYSESYLKQSVDVPGVYFILGIDGERIICACSNPEKTFLLNKNGGLVPLDYMLHLPGMVKGGILYSFSEFNGRTGFSAVNLRSLQVTDFWDSGYTINGVQEIYKDVFLTSKKTKFYSVFLNSEKGIKWEFDGLENYDLQYLSISSFLLCEKSVFVFFSARYDAFTICLDAESGKIIQELKDIKSKLSAFQDNLYFSKGFYKMGRLHPHTFEIEYYDFEKTLAPENITVSSRLFHITADGKMIFVDGLGRPKNKLCILNIQSGILEHVEDFGAEVIIRDLRVVDDKIFVHTSDYVLHLFEYVV